jgi:hypothetical protein
MATEKSKDTGFTDLLHRIKIVLAAVIFPILVLLSWKLFHYQFLAHHSTKELRQEIDKNLSQISAVPLSWQDALNARPQSPRPWFDARLPPINQPTNFPYEVSSVGNSWIDSPEHAPWRAIDSLNLRDKNRFSISGQGQPNSIAWMGTLHSHTGWSDGEQTPHDAFIHARERAVLDFFAVTDHPEYWLFHPDRTFKDLKEIANWHRSPGFTTFAGFEYSHPVFGHYLVIGSEQVCSAIKCPGIQDFHEWLALPENEQAIFAFAHPLQQKDNASRFEFQRMKLVPNLREKLFGIEVIHWDGHDRYMFGFGGSKPFIEEALQQGWEPGAMASQDNHSANWGLSANRIAILSATNDHHALLDALRKRRFYATSSPTLQLSIAVRTDSSMPWQEMGSRIDCATRKCQQIQTRLRLFEPDQFMVPRRVEWILDGRIVARKDFTNLPHDLSMRDEDEFYYAGEVTADLVRTRSTEGAASYLYARIFLGSSMDRMAHTSPVIFTSKSTSR